MYFGISLLAVSFLLHEHTYTRMTKSPTPTPTNIKCAIPSNSDSQSSSHDAITLALAKKESAEHLHGIEELYASMRQRPLLVKAFALHDEASLPSGKEENVKVVHFLRHGQGFHNLMADMAVAQGKQWEQFVPSDNPYCKAEIADAPLTQKGRDQARAVQPLVESMKNQPELVVLSTNCRAIQTGIIAFAPLLKKIPFIAHEMVREETGVHVCDKRRPKSQQMMEFPFVDFDLIESEEDELFRSDRRENKMDVGERIYKFMEWLSLRDETHVAVASHSGWLLTAFNGIFECDESLKAWFQTGELRSVKLVFTKRK